jgi:uncharacterized protein GlcG (DUF336 family)
VRDRPVLEVAILGVVIDGGSFVQVYANAAAVPVRSRLATGMARSAATIAMELGQSAGYAKRPA